jgi:3',5'-cyclic AMP phosphodiesterase CpdA
MAKRTLAAAVLLACLLVAAASAHEADPAGHTTVEQTVAFGPVRDPARPGFLELVAGPGSPYAVRPMGEMVVDPARGERRRSLAYFAQLTDFQLADEESPARVEFVDRGASSAWRPMEAFGPHAIDLSLRQVNAFADASPVRQGDGTRAPMNFGLITGDNSDNQQRNETIWVRQLLEGGTIDPNSGRRVDEYAECGPVIAQALLARETPPEPAYTGVQDYADYSFEAHDFYDPNKPAGQFESWPRYQGLMDRAQKPFEAVGLKVPTYITNGNHDGLVQGNEDANREFERIATGCVKPVLTSTNPPLPSEPSPSFLFSPGPLMFVPPDNPSADLNDPGRAFVDKVELRKIYGAGKQEDDHGFAFIDKAELEASGQSASYYAWDARPGMRFISIDTLSEGGVVGEDPTHASPVQGSSNGNIDDPQFKWLERELEAASAADKLIVVFGHHPVRSLTATITDEMAAPCTGRYDAALDYGGQKDEHGHDPNPGCDLDPRSSSPIHNGEDLAALLTKYPHVIAYVAGHTHENKVLPFAAPEGGTGFWEINTSAVIDYPQQHRLVEVFDNQDGTLALFGTVLDHAAPLATPPDTEDAGVTAAFSTEVLAGLARSFAYNDPQASKPEPPDTPYGAEGAPEDRNVELLLLDPRSSAPGGGTGGGGTGGGGPSGGSPCARAAAFSSARVRARGGRRVRIGFRRRSRGAARVDVLRHSRGRSIPARPRLVRRFRNRLGGFTWNGRGRRVRDGVHTVRIASGRDVRRFTVLRRRGRWFAIRGHRRRPGCRMLRGYALNRPVFGGRQRRVARIAFRLDRPARVTVRVRRAGRVVKRFRVQARRANRTHRLRLRPRRLRPGTYRFTLTAVGRRSRASATIVARRL